MTTKTAQVILATDQHLLAGEVRTQGQRLRECLTDPRTLFLEIQNVHVCRRASAVVENLDHAVVAKESVRLAMIVGTQHEAPDKRVTSFVKKGNIPSFLIVCGYEIRGQLHVQGSSEEVKILSNELEAYLPVTQATVSYDGGSPVAASVVLVNKAHISLLRVGEKQSSPPTTRTRCGGT